MGFLADIGEEFGEIARGEFSTRVVFSDPAWDTFGIWDETYEEVPIQEGDQVINSKIPRILIYYRDRPGDIAQDSAVTIYAINGTLNLFVHVVPDESEGSVLIQLKEKI